MKKLVIQIFLLLVFCCTSVKHFSQVTFHRSTNYISNENARSNISVGFSDVNGDGWDDIIRLNDGTALQIFLNASNEQKSFMIDAGEVISSDAWTTSVGDINNDGINEIMIAGIYTGAHIFELNGNEIQLMAVTEASFYSQASNFADINNDGWLDLFICDDEGASDVFINNQDGGLIKDTMIIDLSTQVSSDNSGNYGSEWLDIDSDGDLDLYISKCKANAFDPADPRRINMLFVNDGKGNYSESGSAFGLALTEQSWASSFGDLDNDGDMDGIVINHGAPHSLMENVENDTFINRSKEIGFIQGLGLQVLMRDFDNNGFLDIFITGDRSFMFWNYGDFDFTIQEKLLPYYNPISFSVGDINRDGFLDIYASYGSGFVGKGPVDDILWENNQNDYNYLALKLNGTISNKNGVGARVIIHGPWGTQSRDVKSGESYGIMNSLNVHFGLGQHSLIDSLHVLWPSGQQDVYKNLTANRYYSLTEGICITDYRNLSYANARFCAGDSITLFSAEDDLEGYFWIDRSTKDAVTVDTNGLFSLLATDINACVVPFNPVKTLLNPTDEEISIELLTPQVVCNQDSILLTVNSMFDVLWQGNFNDSTITVYQPGEYEASILGTCQEYQDSVELDFLMPDEFQVRSDTVEEGEMARLIAYGNEITWFSLNDPDEIIHQGDTLLIENLQETEHYLAQNTLHHIFSSSIAGESINSERILFPPSNTNAKMYFETDRTILLESVDVFTAFKGNRTIQLYTDNNLLYHHKTIELDTGRSTISLDFQIDPGAYYLTTSPDSNLFNFGNVSPGFAMLDGEPNFPYLTEDGLNIMNSSFGPGFYLYFFDWKYRPPDLTCKSEKREVTAFIDLNSSVIDPIEKGFVLYPNPAIQKINLELLDGSMINQILILDVLGKKIVSFGRHEFANSKIELDISKLMPGHYSLLLKYLDGKISTGSFIKI